MTEDGSTQSREGGEKAGYASAERLSHPTTVLTVGVVVCTLLSVVAGMLINDPTGTGRARPAGELGTKSELEPTPMSQRPKRFDLPEPIEVPVGMSDWDEATLAQLRDQAPEV